MGATAAEETMITQTSDGATDKVSSFDVGTSDRLYVVLVNIRCLGVVILMLKVL